MLEAADSNGVIPDQSSVLTSSSVAQVTAQYAGLVGRLSARDRLALVLQPSSSLEACTNSCTPTLYGTMPPKSSKSFRICMSLLDSGHRAHLAFGQGMLVA